MHSISASWMTWCKCRCMAVETREKGCVYSTRGINKRIKILPRGRGRGRIAIGSIPIDTLFSRHLFARKTSDETISSWMRRKKKVFCARDYLCEITEIDKTYIDKSVYWSLTSIAKVFIGPHGYEWLEITQSMRLLRLLWCATQYLRAYLLLSASYVYPRNRRCRSTCHW